MVEPTKQPGAAPKVAAPTAVSGDPTRGGHKVAKIKVTPSGGNKIVSFKDKEYTAEGTEHKAGDFSEDELAAMDASPILTVERFNSDGKSINRFGQLAKGLAPKVPAPAAKSEE